MKLIRKRITPLIIVNQISLLILFTSCKKTPTPIAFSSNVKGNREIYLTDEKGETKVKVTNNLGSDGYPDWSPDGKHIVFYSKYDQGKTWSINIMSADGSNRIRLTQSKNKWDSSPSWSPDGKKIVFAREYKDAEENWHEEVWVMNSDGNNQSQIKPLSGRAPCFTQDGQILFQSNGQKSEIYISNIEGSIITRLTNNDSKDWSPKISPDNKQIAFISDRDGNQEIYVMNIDGTNQKRLTYNKVADWDPCWSPDSSKLIFASETDEYFNLYIINRDGSNIKKFINNGSQPSWLK